MLLSEKINHAFNAQIGHELGNSHQYLAIAAYFESESLFGLARSTPRSRWRSASTR